MGKYESAIHLVDFQSSSGDWNEYDTGNFDDLSGNGSRVCLYQCRARSDLRPDLSFGACAAVQLKYAGSHHDKESCPLETSSAKAQHLT